jgi:citrate synthase
MPTSLYLTAEQAAEALGVSISSLYAYVGRKHIRSQSVPGKRTRLYWREDIENIANGKSEDRVVKWDSILVPETKITLITENGHFYRGQSAIALSETATLEEVAGVLWQQDPALIFPAATSKVPKGFKQARNALSALSALDQAGSLFPILEAANPKSYDMSPLGYARTGGELLRWFASMVVHADRPSIEPIHAVLAKGLSAPAGYDDMIRRLLVLLADHELTAPTYAVRAVANTGSTPYQAVAAGLVAHRGQRMLEGRAPRIRRLLAEVLSEPDPGSPVLERYRAGEAIPGFSHPIYKGGDVRARALLNVMQDRFRKDAAVARLSEAIKVAREGIGVEPDLALISYFIEQKLKYPVNGASTGVVGRVVGWIAHAMEQMESGPMVRPRTAYTGVLPSGG